MSKTALITGVTGQDGAYLAGRELVGVDPRYFRPTEADLLIGNPAKAKVEREASLRRPDEDQVLPSYAVR